MASWADLTYEHVAVRSDGQKHQNGERYDALDTSFLTYDGNNLGLGPGTYDELLFTPRLMSPEEVRSLYLLRAPFYDPTPAIDAGAQKIVTLNNQVSIDAQGVRVRKTGENADTTIVDQDGLKVQNLNRERQVQVGNIAGLPGVPTGVSHGVWGNLDTGVVLANEADSIRVDRDGLSINDGNEPLARLGNIQGMAGVPTGVTKGLWGELGTGIYIRGAMKLLGYTNGAVFHDFPGTLNTGITGSSEMIVPVTRMGGIVVPPGTVTVVVSVTRVAANHADVDTTRWSVSDFNFDGGSWPISWPVAVPNEVTINNASISARLSVRAFVNGLTNIQGSFTYTLQLWHAAE